LELAEETRTATAADVWAEMLWQTEVLYLKDTYVKALRHAANVLATGIREMTRRTDTTPCTSAITEALLAALEAERATPPRVGNKRPTPLHRVRTHNKAAGHRAGPINRESSRKHRKEEGKGGRLGKDRE
jgi:hypothetical protein